MGDGAGTTPGRACTGACNLISANGTGVVIEGTGATGNQVLGNFIGPDVNGTASLGNAGDGVHINGAPNTILGRIIPPLRNIISGNDGDGVLIQGPTATGNKVTGNYIGADTAGDPNLGNRLDGVRILDASDNLIGGTVAGEGNIIAANGAGVNGNGVSVVGVSATGNTIRQNSIFNNGGLGIDLGRNGVTPNDSGDARTAPDGDEGPNNLVNFPVGVTSFFDGANTIISGLIMHQNPLLTQVDVYAVEKVDGSGFGEGRVYLGTADPSSVPPGITASGTFRLSVPGPLPFPFVSATITTALDGTSEFSAVCGGEGDNNPDNDGDGICDTWKLRGIDFDGDGNVDLRLDQPPFNADPNHRDMFIEIDYMEGAGHNSHRPDRLALVQVIRAFDEAPVNTNNPNGGPGIAVHFVGSQVLVDEAVAHVTPLKFNPARANQAGVVHAGTFDGIKLGTSSNNPCQRAGDADNPAIPVGESGTFGREADRLSGNCRNILGAWRLVFRYALFAHDHSHNPGSSGTSELLGNDFMVTLGGWSDAGVLRQGGRTMVESGTLMHELGHTLNLRHGGNNNTHRKPNYLSVMNYNFQMGSIVANRPLNYSFRAAGDLNVLNEASPPGLIEPVGISGPAPPADLAARWPETAFTYYNAASDTCPFQHVPTVGSIDWNQAGGAADVNVVAGINDPDRTPSAAGLEACQLPLNQTGVFSSFDDWNHILLGFRSQDKFDDAQHGAPADGDEELTFEEATADAALSDYDDDSISNLDDNCPAVANLSQVDTNGDGIGDACSLAPLAVNPPSVERGSPATGTVNLTLPAPAGGAFIELFSSDETIAGLPRNITIAEGASSADFTITTVPGAAAATVTISAL